MNIKTTEEVAGFFKDILQRLTPDEVQGLKFEELDDENFKTTSERVDEILSGVGVQDLYQAVLTLAAPTVGFNLLGTGKREVGLNAPVSEKDKDLQYRLIDEEVGELKKAIEENNKAEILDGIVDSMVVLLGIALNQGVLPFLPAAFAIIAHNNLTKLVKGPDGVYSSVRDAGGKIQKPEGYQKVDFSEIFPMLKEEVSNG